MNAYRKSVLAVLFAVFLSLAAGCVNSIPENTNGSAASGNQVDNSRMAVLAKTYTDKMYKFSVDFPANWAFKVFDTVGVVKGNGTNIELATSDNLFGPDGGIMFLVDRKQYEEISIYGQVGHVAIPDNDYKKEKFMTSSGVKGYLLSREISGRVSIYLVLEEEFHAVHINMSTEVFNEKKDQVMEVLKSIKIGINTK